MSRQLISNVISKKALRKGQQLTLRHLKDIIINCAGPFGSNTSLIHDKRFSEYSKDGFTILKQIKYPNKLENNIKNEMIELARHIKGEVGDGSTSLTALSSLIFDGLCEFEKSTTLSPYKISEIFKDVTEDIIKEIKKRGRECTLDDIYDISMISTNGNVEVSNAIKQIYEDYGMDVFITVETSTDEQHRVVVHDGVTLKTGYSDVAYINSNTDAKCIIKNANIYAFTDPVDTPEMAAFLDKIIFDNIIQPYQLNKVENIIPTVILAPRLSRDLSSSIDSLVDWLYEIQNKASNDQKPPIVIITNFSANDNYSDIVKLCGCKPIHKYIDPKMQENDIKEGKAPTLDTITSWYGKADIVECSASTTQFINPEAMFDHDKDGNRIGEPGDGHIYRALIDFLEKEIEQAKVDNDESLVFSLTRRLQSLKANMVEYFIGGINVIDRDSLKSLAKDAVFNCRSAAEHGVGCGANFETIMACNKLTYRGDKNRTQINLLIYEAYLDLLEILYQSGYEGDVDKLISESIEKGMPVNIATYEFDGKVLSSINSDIVILSSIAKIITVMFSANQGIVPEVVDNVYGVYELDD